MKMNVLNVSLNLSIERGSIMQKSVYLAAIALVVIGALNWGLVGLAQFDLIAYLFDGTAAFLSRLIYSFVGVAGLLLAVIPVWRRIAPGAPCVSK